MEFQYHRQRYQPCGEGSWQRSSFLPLPSSRLAQPPEPPCPVQVLNQLYQKLICLALNLEMTMGHFYLIPAFHNITIFHSFKAKILASSWWDRLRQCQLYEQLDWRKSPKKMPDASTSRWASLRSLPSHLSWQTQLSYDSNFGIKNCFFWLISNSTMSAFIKKHQ